MHVSTSNSEDMYFLGSLSTANESNMLPLDIFLNDNKNIIPFINNFRYLGATSHWISLKTLKSKPASTKPSLKWDY